MGNQKVGTNLNELNVLLAEMRGQIESINIKVGLVLEQTKKINERVDTLEEWKHEHLLKSSEEFLEYKFIKKYPKVSLLVLLLLLAVMVVSLFTKGINI